MKNVILAGIAGAVVLFIWSSISWMALPWHEKTLRGFKDETAVAAVLRANVDQSAVYLLPNKYDPAAAPGATPMVFAAVSLQGMTGMNRALIVAFITQLVAAWLVAYLLAQTSLGCYFGRVFFVLVFGVAAAIVANLPYWNWWGFGVNYTLVTMADMIIGWLLAGFAIAAIVKCRPCTPCPAKGNNQPPIP